MKHRLNHILKALCSLLLGALGMSCGEKASGGFMGGIGDGENICMYGVPTRTYQVTLTVTDDAKKPINDIKVTHYEGDFELSKVLTDAQGKAYTTISGMEWGNRRLVLTDIDGEANGGKFKEYEVKPEELKFEQISPGDGAWNVGTFRVNADITMEREK